MNAGTDASDSSGFEGGGAAFAIVSLIARRRWWVLGFFAFFLIVFALAEVSALRDDPVVHETLEIVVFVLFAVLLLGVWVLVEILTRAVASRNQAVALVELKHQLSTQLALAPDWTSLVGHLVAFCGSFFALDRALLLLRDTTSGKLAPVAWWPSDSAMGADASSLCSCPDDVPGDLHPIQGSPPGEACSGYCLPLHLGAGLVGKLLLYLPAGRLLDADQIHTLNSIASDMTIGLVTAQQRQAQATLMLERVRLGQRHRLAQELHDTLGQKLVYLRLELDRLARDGAALEQPGLEHMLQAANEACALVRGTLVVLESEGTASLFDLLMSHGRQIGQRTPLQVRFDETGSPQALPPERLQQVFYIVGEALSNVERHAHAGSVDVHLRWREGELLVQVRDDGQGFDPSVAAGADHFGLAIMRERAERLGGRLRLNSSPGRGTRLKLTIPLHQDQGQMEFAPGEAVEGNL